MPVSCDPSDLMEAAACYNCLTPHQRQIIRAYLLAVLAGASTDPSTLLVDACVLGALTTGQRRQLTAALLCAANNSNDYCRDDVLDDAACMRCFTERQREMVDISLLVDLTGESSDPSDLMRAASDFQVLTTNQASQVIVYLSNLLAQGGFGTVGILGEGGQPMLGELGEQILGE